MLCNFSPIAFSIFGFGVHWYSLAYIFGIMVALQVTLKLSARFELSFSREIINDYVAYAIAGIVIGGRLGHVLFYDLQYYLACPADIVKVWKGGMSFYGGFLGVITSTLVFCKMRKIDFLRFMDLWSVSVPIGVFFGRIANFINGELLGKPSDIAWCVVFRDGISRHPSQIYEALLEGVLLFLLMILSVKLKSYKIRGVLSGIFCFGYGCARFIAEFFREPDSDFSYKLFDVSGLNLNQYLSIAMLCLGIYVIFTRGKNGKSAAVAV